jgi:hypothetical protein
MEWPRIVPAALGLIALACYAAFSAFLMLDLYLEYPTAGFVLRSLLPWAALGNLVGIVTAIVRARKDGKLVLVTGLVLNIVPPITMIGLFLWLLLSFKM